MPTPQRKIQYILPPIIATLLLLWYIKSATSDIIYTDYIRLVNTYLPDVWNPSKFFVPDVLTRIPIHYLSRGINTTFFGFSTTFDMILGVLSLGLSGLIIAIYCEKKKVSYLWYIIIIFVLFNLNKWEMLTNGSGWAHFLAFACFFYHYLVFDRVLSGDGKKHDQLRLYILPFVITLAVAGPYCAVYTVTMLAAYAAAILLNRASRPSSTAVAATTNKTWLLASICIIIPFLLYLWSNSYAIEDHADTQAISAMELFTDAPGFFSGFLLKSLASLIIGGETLTGWLENGVITDSKIYLIGVIAVIGYLIAILAILRFRLYKETMLPCLLLLSGMGNHAIVLVTRYIFVNENYGMSSRYALQYQTGILGILLVLAVLWKRIKPAFLKTVSALFVIALMAGQIHTLRAEIIKAPHREEYSEKIAAAALNFENLSDDELKAMFDYRKSRPDSGAKVRRALTILRDNHWNIFR